MNEALRRLRRLEAVAPENPPRGVDRSARCEFPRLLRAPSSPAVDRLLLTRRFIAKRSSINGLWRVRPTRAYSERKEIGRGFPPMTECDSS